ncbi:MAG: hypothetical protein HY681_00955 [Chloroflexi bacterium]|nr:hypothetical protein [Chloroflexota bacterium]
MIEYPTARMQMGCGVDGDPHCITRRLMDPAYFTTDIWHNISTALRLIWLYVFFILGFVTNFLIAHAVIPSLASTHQVSPKIVRLRALVYIFAFSILGVAILTFIAMLLQLDVLTRVWPRVFM